MRLYSVISAILLSVAFTNQIFAWGQTGHRVIGAVAENHLTKKARKQICELLGGESLAIASTWMDEIRSDSTYDHTHDWHWVTIPDDKGYSETEKNPRGDLVEAIGRMREMLKDESISKEERVKALRMLVHLVGDLHQPMHVGTGLDRGGNDVKVEFFREKSNLHRVWDSDIIDHKQLSFSELAKSIDHAPKDQVARWQQGTVIDWAEEAKDYRGRVYDLNGKDYLSYEYVYENWDLVESQLLKGGIRLAGMLNEIFD